MSLSSFLPSLQNRSAAAIGIGKDESAVGVGGGGAADRLSSSVVPVTVRSIKLFGIVGPAGSGTLRQGHGTAMI